VDDKIPFLGAAASHAALDRLAHDTSPSALYKAVADDLRVAYDGSAEARGSSERAPWQLREREAFLLRLRAENRRSLLEIGAGAGHDSRYFADNGVDVVATDLSPQMVAVCRRLGLNACVMDVLALGPPVGIFESAYAMNSLLHVPNVDLPKALAAVHRCLRSGALFYLGVYGGPQPFEGVLDSDWHVPRRFFAFRTDAQMLAAAEPLFQVEDFHVVEEDCYFQALTLRALAHIA
jgi:SAM-dependent methyltransferase